MSRRSYHQFCGLAAALDVVGERWALLVVRDLAPGPRRFTDLFNGLPGIATDVLADRLRSLEAAGVVEQRAIRHPVPSKLYALTARGDELAAIAAQLADWGMPLLPAPLGDEGQAYRKHPRWALQTMTRGYRGGLMPGAYRFTVDDDELTVSVSARPSRATMVYGPGSATPVLDVRCTTPEFFALVQGRRPPSPRLSRAEREVMAAFVAAMPLVVPATAGR